MFSCSRPEGARPGSYVILKGAGPVPPWPKERDRFVFLAALQRSLSRHGTGCAGYCLLDRSAHLLLTAPPGEDLRRAAAEACSGYGRYWRGWYAGRRPVFRPARAAAVPQELLWDALAHVETAPVRAELAAAAEGYRWSSAPAHAGWGRSYLRLESGQWSACWSCRQWRGRLAEWGGDLQRLRAVLRLVENAKPLRALAAPASEPCPPPLFRGPAQAARAAAGCL